MKQITKNWEEISGLVRRINPWFVTSKTSNPQSNSKEEIKPMTHNT